MLQFQYDIFPQMLLGSIKAWSSVQLCLAMALLISDWTIEFLTLIVHLILMICWEMKESWEVNTS